MLNSGTVPHAELNILIADDDAGDRKQIGRSLQRSRLSCRWVETADMTQALAACDGATFDCAVIDYRMPGQDGLDGIAVLNGRFPEMPVIMATGAGDETVATEAIKRGAMDYISKANINPESIGHVIENACERACLRRKVARQREDLERFAGILVHDLSAPIASLQMFARVIEQEMHADNVDKSKIVNHCRYLADAGQRAAALIDTLYAYTRADMHVPFEPVDMGSVVAGARDNLKHQIAERGAQVMFGDLPMVVGNAPQLTQLMQNLIGNAIKYCENVPPTVHVSAAQDSEGSWRVAVTDNGIGIAEEYRQRVFEPFMRLHNAQSYPGSGIGLATCKKVVDRHGGKIGCEANDVQGTTFFFTLPGAPENANGRDG